MNPRSTRLMLALVIFGGALWWVSQKDDYTPQATVPEEITRLVSFDRSAVDRIDLTRGEEAIAIVRDGDSWKVASSWNYPADSDTIDDLLDKMKEIGGADLRGERATSHGAFEVDSSSGIGVLLSGEGIGLPVGVVIGKADGFERSFLRIDESDSVYSVTPNIRYARGFGGIRLDRSSWIDPTLYRLPDAALVVSVTMVTPDGVVRIERDPIPDPPAEGAPETPQESWSVVEPERFAADKRIVDGLLGALKNVRGAEAADPVTASQLGLDPPARTIELEMESGEVVALHFGSSIDLDAGGSGFASRRLGDGRILRARSWVADGLFKTVDQFRQPEPEAPAVTPDSGGEEAQGAGSEGGAATGDGTELPVNSAETGGRP